MIIQLITKKIRIKSIHFKTEDSFYLPSHRINILYFIDKITPEYQNYLQYLTKQHKINIVIVTVDDQVNSSKFVTVVNTTPKWYIHTLFKNPLVFRCVCGIGQQAEQLALAFSQYLGYRIKLLSETETLEDVLNQIPDKAILIKPSEGIGDLLMTLPAAKVYYDQGYSVSLLTWPGGREVLENLKWVREIITKKSKAQIWKYEKFFDLHTPLNNYSSSLTHQHRVLATAELLGVRDQIKSILPEINLTEDEEQFGQLFAHIKKSLVVGLISWHSVRRSYPSDLIYELLQQLIEHSYTPIVIHHKYQSDIPNGCINLTGTITIRQLFSLVKYTKAVLTIDSSLLHIAAAFKTPTILLPAEIDYNWRIYPEVYTEVVIPRVSCYPCNEQYSSSSQCKLDQNACLRSIRIDDVIRAVDRVFNYREKLNENH